MRKAPVALIALYCIMVCGFTTACSPSLRGLVTSNINQFGPPVQLKFKTEPPGSAGAGVTFGTLPAVAVEDASGNIVTSATQAVTLAAYTDSTCSTAAPGAFTVTNNNLTPTSGVASYTGVNYGDVAGTTIYIGASAIGLTSACSSAVTITPGNPAKLIFSTEPADPSATAGVAFATQPVVTVEDSYGNVVTSASNSIQLKPFTNSTCTTSGAGTLSAATNPLTPSSGVATFTGANYTKSGTFYVGAISSGLTSACSNAISVAAGPPANLVWSTTPYPYLSVNGCSGGLQFGVQDAYGNTATVAGSSVTVNLIGGGSSKFYSDSACSSNITTSSIAVGMSSTTTIYTSDTVNEQEWSYATATGLADSYHQIFAWGVTVVPSFSLTSFNTGTCVSFTLTTEDAKGTVMAPAVSGAEVFKGYSGRYAIYSDSGCTMAISQMNITAGTSNYTFYFQDVRAEALSSGLLYQISGTSDLLNGGNGPTLTISAATANTLVVTGPTFEPPGTCAGPYTVTTTDLYGNPSNISGSALTVNLTASGSAGIFSDSGCSSSTASVSIGVGSAAQTFFVKDATTEISNLSASATAFSSGTFNLDSTSTSLLQQVAVGGQFTCVLIKGGVKCWGNNSQGELGNGTTTSSLIPVSVSGLSSGVSNVVASNVVVGDGPGFACAVKTDQTVWCWGDGSQGDLGQGTYTNSTTPLEVMVGGSPLLSSSISAGSGEVCVVTPTSALYCWGYGTPLSSGPTLVLGSGVVSAAANQDHVCAVESAGDLKCMGSNYYGQLGTGSTNSSSTLAQVSGLGSGVSGVTVSTYASCAAVSGTVYCWSTAGYGQSNSTTPALVGAPLTSGVASVVGGGGSNDYFFALTTGGALYGWGANGGANSGIFGNGSTTGYSYTSPHEILSAGVTSVSVTDGEFTACAIISGNLECWGNNTYGQDGTQTLNDNLVATYSGSLE